MNTCKLDKFCYVCGHYIQPGKGTYKSEKFKEIYTSYFSDFVIEETWVPKYTCKTCYNHLLQWQKKERDQMLFGIPMKWTTNVDVNGEHDAENCYGCKNFHAGMNVKKEIQLVAVASAQMPIGHSEFIPVPVPTQRSPDFSDFTVGTDFTFTSDSTYVPSTSAAADSHKEPILITQQKLNFIVAKLELSKKKSEMLASWLKYSNLLAPDVRVTTFRNRQIECQKLFKVAKGNTFAYCPDVELLMHEMNIKYKSNDWRLFIDSSKNGLKAILLHKTNKLPEIPIAYSTDTKETYEKMKEILKLVKYDKHQWRICCDLKVVAMLCGLQGGYTKYMCFMCNWDSRFKGDQYCFHGWQDRTTHEIGKANVIGKALVPKEKILLPPLHVKLGIVKSFLKTIAKRDVVLTTLKGIFGGISPKKLKNGVVNGPDIRKLIQSSHADTFENVLIDNETTAWTAVKEIIAGLLGKHRSTTYEADVNKMMDAFRMIGVNMSLKIHFLHHHLNYFGQQLATESDEQGERYHQIAMPFECRYTS